ncbi:2-octaprenyl-6-methoxyphenyl hydroxylase [Algibacillus agarilyticus]|uniref:2-octaprenyl-6-methoxyphenyl hydroxylase n=1 Tax=Algibacillus agarilyticus TaxID=2234133 RepID=UPI000DD04BC1|nr:2-octaprenyl-6-methoxyphenyl hydroxylase [Algibacillus agarilyticus]
MISKPEFDLSIVGAGLAGASLALALHKTMPMLKIALIEAQPVHTKTHGSFDGRALALSYGSTLLLQQWDIWPVLEPHVGTIKHIEISDQHQLGYSLINAQAYQKPALGYVIEAQVLGAALHQALNACSGQISLFCPHSVVSLQQSTEQVELTLDNNHVVCSKLVVGADGAQSRIRELLNIKQQATAYDQVAISCNVRVKSTAPHTAFERFTAQGPLAMLPMLDERYGLIWCQQAHRVDHLMALSDREFVAELQKALGYRAGELIEVGTRKTYPLIRQIADQVYHHRCLLVANAAHTIHPIAGQGLNLGLRDIEQIVFALKNANKHNTDIGEFVTWQHYIEHRQRDTQKIVAATDGLVRIFSNNDFLLSHVRTKALSGFERFGLAKNWFAQQAMGLSK